MAMETPFYSLAELLQEVALQQATERTSSNQPDASTTEVKIESDELLASYLDEKAKNDAVAIQIDNTLETLAHKPTSRKSKHSEEEVLWQQLEFAIHGLEQERKQVPVLDSTSVLETRTRTEIHDIGSQLDGALEKLKRELASERDSLEREKQLLADLGTVREGLQKRQTQLQQRKAKDLTSASAIKELTDKRNKESKRFATLLDKLLVIGEALFAGQNEKVITLRFYLDTLLNRAWDRPLDPWVRPKDLIHGKRAKQVDEAMIQLFIRANVIVAHPRDARRWKMVAFHKATRAST